MYRWERDARLLIKSLIYAEMSEREIQLWNNLRMALDEIERLRRIEDEQRQPEWGENCYGDGY